MFGFNKKRLTLSAKDYDQVQEHLSDLLLSKKAEIKDEDFRLAGGTSVFIKKYKVDNRSLTVARSDDDSVTISGSREIIGNIKSHLDKAQRDRSR